MKTSYSLKLQLACALLVTGAVFFLGAKNSQDEEATRRKLPVATVNAKPVTLEYLEALSSKQNPALRKELEQEEKQLDFLDKILNIEVLSHEATRRGYNKHLEVESVVKNQLAALMHGRIADSIEEIEPTEEALRAKYKEDENTYHKPEMTRARHILLKDKDKAEALLKELKETKINQHDFRKKAQDLSEDEATGSRGGDLTFFTKPGVLREQDPKVNPILVEAAFKIEKNGHLYNKVLKTDQGYHILMRTGHRDKTDLSFEQARKRMTVLLKRDSRKNQIEEKVNKIGESFKVEIFEENLKLVVIDLSTAPSERDLKPGTLLDRNSGEKLQMKVPKPRPKKSK